MNKKCLFILFLCFFTVNTAYTYPVTVKTFKGKYIKFEAEDNTTVLELKQKIEQKTGFSADVQRLIIQGKEMINQKTLLDYKARTETIHLVTILRTPSAKVDKLFKAFSDIISQ